MAQNDIFMAIDAAMAVVKDIAIIDCLRRVENAQREYLLAEADKNREKSDELIRSIRKIDIEKMKLEATYRKVKDSLGSEGEKCINNVIKLLDKKRADYLSRKKDIMK